MTTLPVRSVVLLAAVAFALAAATARSQTATGDCAAKTSSPEDRAKAAEGLEKLLPDLKAADSRLAQDTFDIAAAVRQAGPDADALFVWVRDRTVWVPYRGALRGARGVLMDRMGNSLDRALLLAEMLRSTGITVRLAHGEIPTADAKAAYAVLCKRPAAPATATEAPSAKPSHARMDRLAATMRRRVADQTPALVAAVAVADAAPLAPIDPAAESIASLKDHWWVQRDDHGKWVDLDPLLPDAKPGKAMAVATRTTKFEGGSATSAVSPNDAHTVVITVVAERWTAKGLKESVVLRHELRPADVIGKPIFLAHVPLVWPTGAQASGRRLTDPLKAALLEKQEWVPVLSVGGTRITQGSVTDAGEINLKPTMDAAAGAGKQAKSEAFKALDALGDAPAAAQRSGWFTAEWIDYEVRSPGRPAYKQRRQVFDLIGPAARAAGVPQEPALSDDARVNAGLALTGRIDIVLLCCQPSPQFAGHVLLSNLISNYTALIDRVRSGHKAAADDKPAAEWSNCGPSLYAFSIARRQWSRFRDDLYLDRPNVVAMHTTFHTGADDALVLEEALDVVANDVAVRPGTGRNATELRLEQGVSDTNAEAAILPRGATGENTADLYAAARDGGDRG